MTRTWICRNEEETAAAAIEIADALQFPCTLCLYGDLGAGKTSFCRALIRHLLNKRDEVIPSPTYTLVQTYDHDRIWHFDLYRLENPDQLYDIGWEEALTADLCLIEWPERLGTMKPKQSLDITIEVLHDGSRQITMKDNENE